MQIQKSLFTIPNLVESLTVGILRADSYFPGYYIPPGFDKVISDWALTIETWDKEWIAKTMFEGTYDEIKQAAKKFVHSHPICQMWTNWNAPESGYAFTSAYSPLATEREFIDLDAIVLNMMAHVKELNNFFTTMDKLIND